MLYELPNGDYITLTYVISVSTIIDDEHGSRVIIGLKDKKFTTVKFDLPESARDWVRQFVSDVNAASSEDSAD